MLARSAGIRRNQNGRLSLSAHTTLSGFPIVVALLTQPPPNAERERKGRKGFIHSVKDAQKKKPFRTHELLSALSLPLRFGPPRSHCMKCLSVIVTRGAEIPAIFFLLSHAAPHNDFGASAASLDADEGKGSPCRGWAIYR